MIRLLKTLEDTTGELSEQARLESIKGRCEELSSNDEGSATKSAVACPRDRHVPVLPGRIFPSRLNQIIESV